jgi:hypothetical protein
MCTTGIAKPMWVILNEMGIEFEDMTPEAFRRFEVNMAPVLDRLLGVPFVPARRLSSGVPPRVRYRMRKLWIKREGRTYYLFERANEDLPSHSRSSYVTLATQTEESA